VPRLFETMGGAVESDQVEGLPLLGMRGLSRTRSTLRLKRAMDVVVPAVALLLLAPLLVIVAAAIRIESRGPVLFRQRRIGRADEPFTLYKFRTMVSDADSLKPQLEHLNEAAGPMFKIRGDPRITRVGRILRNYSLDELPQLWNVLLGEMSLVGPRPLIPSESTQVIGRHRDRLELMPGLTGPWQVLGRSSISFDEMVKLDYLYVAEWSLWRDVKLLMRTAAVVLRGNGY
jgi:lipopolysaccharide/colanic/teichoic acid biosynthesis glycosyltransferase